MLKFIKPNHWPPGGKLFYYVAETDTWFESRSSFKELEDRLKLHYAANKLALPDNLHQLIEDFICRNVREGFCSGDNEGRPLSPYRNLSFWQIERGTRKLMQGAKVVEKPVAEKRMNTCLKCPMNLRHLCTTCNGLSSIVKALVGNRSLPADSFVGVCGATGFLVAAQVWADKSIKTEGVLPDFCWISTEVTND